MTDERPALADEPTSYAKVSKCLKVAAEVDTLKADRDAALDSLRESDDLRAQQSTELVELRATAARLRAALERYGDHDERRRLVERAVREGWREGWTDACGGTADTSSENVAAIADRILAAPEPRAGEP